MYIKFTNTIEDHTKFQLYHSANSPSVKKLHFSARIIPISIFIVLAFLGGLEHKVGLISFGLIAAVITYFYVPYSIRKKTVKLSEEMYKEGGNKGFFCEHVLEIGDNHLIEKTDQGESSWLFSCVDRICLTDEYAFIYVSSVQSHIVPIKRISEGDIDAFIKELQLKCNL